MSTINVLISDSNYNNNFIFPGFFIISDGSSSLISSSDTIASFILLNAVSEYCSVLQKPEFRHDFLNFQGNFYMIQKIIAIMLVLLDQIRSKNIPSKVLFHKFLQFKIALRLNRLVCGDNVDVLSKTDEPFVDITITSPPYRNAIDYSMHAKHGNDPKKNYRGKLSISVSDYIDDMTRIFKEIYRVTKEGGYCCIVIGNEINKGTLEPLPALLISKLYEQGWFLHEEIIWHKITGGANRAGSFVQHPYPSYFRANIMHEIILVMRKGKNRLRRLEYAFTNINQDVTWKEIVNSVWHIAPVPPGFLEHPCPYPEEIPYRLLNLYSNENDVVLDPFNGAGQTTKVAKYLKRKYFGIDIQKTYVDYAKSRLKEAPHIRDESLTLEFEREGGSIPKWTKLPTRKVVSKADYR